MLMIAHSFDIRDKKLSSYQANLDASFLMANFLVPDEDIQGPGGRKVNYNLPQLWNLYTNISLIMLSDAVHGTGREIQRMVKLHVVQCALSGRMLEITGNYFIAC